MSWDAFGNWTDEQRRLIDAYERLLIETNRGINLISRSTAKDVRARHIEHTLTLALRDFRDGSSVVDWGTGGGLPGVPLAIRFPNVTFHLVDSILKKVRAVESIVDALELKNVIVHRMRAEDWTSPVDYAVSRATAPLFDLWSWTAPVLTESYLATDREWPQGLITLKGGDLAPEMSRLGRLRERAVCEKMSLQELTGRRDFEDKFIVCVRRAARLKSDAGSK